MKKTKLSFTRETIRQLSVTDLSKVAGGLTNSQAFCGTAGDTVCICQTNYPNSCPCVDTAKCEPSYMHCG